MADIRTLTVEGTTYNIKDATARADIVTLQQRTEGLEQLQTDVNKLKRDTTDIDTIRTDVNNLKTNTADLPQIRQNIETNTNDISNLENTVENKADANGTYEDLTAGNIVSSQYAEDSTPYLFRASGGGIKVGSPEYDTVVGGTVAFNQLLNPANYTASTENDNLIFTNNGDGSFTIQLKQDVSSGFGFSFGKNIGSAYVKIPGNHKYAIIDNNPQPTGIYYRNGFTSTNIGYNIIANQPANSENFLPSLWFTTSAVAGTYTFKPMFIDLTRAFGTAIADYLYTLETGFSVLKQLINTNSHIPYNAGSLESVQGLVSHDMVGFNQFDGVQESGRIDFNTGNLVADNAYIRSSNFIPCIPDTTYYAKSDEAPTFVGIFYDDNKNYVGYLATASFRNKEFTTPQNARFIKFFGTVSATNICINISGNRNGEYEPYEKHSYQLDSSIVLRGIPKLSADNKLYYDGDIYSHDGKIQRRYGIVDIGTLNFSRSQNTETRQVYTSTVIQNIKQVTSNTELPNILADNFVTVSINTTWAGGMISFSNITSGNLAFITPASAYADASAFKTAMSGHYLIFEFATPTEETASPYAEIQKVSAYGTEEYVVSDSIVPVGHNTKYRVDLKAKLEDLPAIPDAPTTDGTYKLIATVSNGTIIYSWEANT